MAWRCVGRDPQPLLLLQLPQALMCLLLLLLLSLKCLLLQLLLVPSRRLPRCHHSQP